MTDKREIIRQIEELLGPEGGPEVSDEEWLTTLLDRAIVRANNH
jgi:hypothetical protein